MPTAHTTHPTLDQLCDLRDGAPPVPRDDTAFDVDVVAHVASCAACQDALAFVATLAHSTAQLSAPAPDAALRARILAGAMSSAATRAEAPVQPPAAVHVDVPAPIDVTVLPVRARRRWLTPLLAAAAALAVVLLGPLFRDAPELVAGSTAGSMTLSTATPRAGEAVTVRYVPGASLGRFATLRLRARVRTTHGDSYTANIPVVTVATLSRQRDGSYGGTFTLPDSILYAALAVEDTAAAEIDDRDGRTWEVMRATADGRVRLGALDQRANDHMGRSWEEVFATARRMAAEYPDSLAAWSYLSATHRWMGLSDDSVRALHRPRIRAFDAVLRARATVPAEDVGRMYWYAHSIDSTTSEYWKARLMREAPSTSFGVMNRMIDALRTLYTSRDTTAALQSLERVWADATPDRHAEVAGYATSIAVASGDTAALRRWTDRTLALAMGDTPRLSRAPTVRRVAFDFARVPALRAEGLRRLRDELTRLDGPSPSMRALDETQAEYDARIRRSRRATTAALGRALAMDGQHRAALDALTASAATGWDPEIFGALRTEALAVGDTATALEASARLAIDPRTDSARAASLDAFGNGRLGAQAWQARRAAAQREFVQRTLDAAQPRTITRALPVRALDGRSVDLQPSLRGRVTVVAVLSRFCGPAVEVLPELAAVAARLRRDGVQTTLVYEETTPSADLSAFLTKHAVTLPVMLDDRKAVSETFNQWGTPYFYVVDAGGRIMFEPTSDVDELLVNATAVRLAGAIP